MLDVEVEEKQALSKKNELSAYLLELKAERDQLLVGRNALTDPIATTVRLAKIDAELAAGKEVFQKVSVLYEDLRHRQEKDKGRMNHLFSVTRRG